MIRATVCLVALSIALLEQRDQAAEVFRRWSASVVTVEVPTVQGSGAVVKTWAIATNFHVIAGWQAARIVSTDGKTVVAPVVYADTQEDVAVLANLKQFSLGLPFKLRTKALEVGERVFAIGSPAGLAGSMSEGIVSGFRGNGELVQHTAAISQGSSGGPLVDRTGALVGINQLFVVPGQSLNFAVSASRVELAIEQVEDHATYGGGETGIPERALDDSYAQRTKRRFGWTSLSNEETFRRVRARFCPEFNGTMRLRALPPDFLDRRLPRSN